MIVGAILPLECKSRLVSELGRNCKGLFHLSEPLTAQGTRNLSSTTTCGVIYHAANQINTSKCPPPTAYMSGAKEGPTHGWL
jgi:hypothetical protein